MQASEEDTVLLLRQLHNTARVFGNATAKEIKRIETEKGPNVQFAGEKRVFGFLRVGEEWLVCWDVEFEFWVDVLNAF